ncbi:MAG: ABC transporter ATP-binding protein [Chloroflexi bacterium]|nr:ABC transporter ATP-binding protein [Chloroflexota bacterium]
MPEWMIELADISKRYGNTLANDHINLRILKGELMTLLGPSGCGKTTTLRCITGQVIPDEGRVFIDSIDVTDIPTHRRELGMVFQNFALFPHMSVYDNVGFPLMIRGLPQEKRHELVLETLRLIRMEGYAQQYPRQLSGGQQQRVGLARALAYHPKVLLLDEPLSNLDAKLREEMRFEIRDLISRLGITAVYVTHDQAEALAIADRVAVMNAGRIEQIGTPDEIYQSPRSRFVADFIGLSNFVRGRVVSLQQGYAIVQADDLQPRPAVRPAHDGERGEGLLVPAEEGIQEGQELLVFIRPNDVNLLPIGSERARNTYTGQIHKLTYLGDKIDYRVLVGEGVHIRVQTDGKVRFHEGEEVKVQLPESCCRVIKE